VETARGRYRLARSQSLSLLLLAALARSAAAQAPDSVAVVMPVMDIRAERLDRQALLDRQPGFVSVFEPSDWSDGGRSAAELLSRAAGIHVRDRGGLGRYSSVSSRGAASKRVAVFLDGVPLTGPHRGSFDFSQIDLNGLERVEVYRGNAPLQLGGGSLGGAIHLFSSTAQSSRLSLSTASHGELSLQAASGSRFGDWSLHGSGELHRGEGNWKHLDDNGTLYNSGDDRWRERANNEVNSGSLLLSASQHLGSWRLAVSEQWREHRRGEPGLNWNPSAEAEEEMRTHQLRVALESPHAAMRTLRLLELSHRFEAQGFSDTQASFGLPTDRTDRLHSFALAAEGAATSAGPRVWRAELRQTLMWSEDLAQRNARGDIQRSWTAAVAAQPAFDLGRHWRISPGARAELGWDRFHSTPSTSLLPTGALELARALHSQVQLGLLRRATHVDLKANIARAERVPTMLERFGARGGVVGNDELRVETGWLRDVGFVVHGQGGRMELSYFDNGYDDLIGFVPVAANKVKAMNVARASSRGIEFALEWTPDDRFRHDLSITGIRTLDRSDDANFGGKRLLGEPDYEMSQRSSLRGGPWEFSYELTALGASFLERGERNRLSARALFGLGLSRDFGALRATVRGSNLGDQEYTDFWGYPMPGRTWRLSLDWGGNR
jgi:iron complex outermembrane receptor protein